jgi:PPOX class probable F420-dependent enzyme
MEIETARDFLRTHHRAVLSTYRRDGRAQLSPVLATVDAEGFVLVSTPQASAKTRNIRRDPRVTLCALSDTFFGDWLYVDGQAAIVSLPDAMEPLIDYYRRTAGEHPDWNDYRAAMVRDERVLLRITIEHAGPNPSG